MKKFFTVLFYTFMIISFFSSCASKNELEIKPETERNEDFTGDVNSFFLGNLQLYTKQSVNSPRITEFDVYYSPRSNSILLSFKLGLDIVQLTYSYSERKNLYESAQKYIYNYENNLITTEKPTSKNAYYKGTTPISWGVFGLTHSVTTDYQVNTEYLWIDRPYYRIRYSAKKDVSTDSSSPAFSIYISPSQWQKIFEMCDQETLEQEVDEILSQADVF